MIRKILISTIFIGLLCHFAYGQDIDNSKLDNYFDVLENHDKFMGSVAVSKNGELIYTRTIGFADIENKLKANENSKYRTGSISKTFTAVLVLKANRLPTRQAAVILFSFNISL